jgi:outer membrane lipase/esterase
LREFNKTVAKARNAVQISPNDKPITGETDMKKFLAGTALCLSLSAHIVSAQEFSNLVVFGDSLSDTGNIAKIVPASVLATIPPGTSGVPVPPYYNFRFSNGPIYADTLGAHLGITSPTLDFAVGGAYSGKLNETIGAVPVSGVNLSPLLNGLNAVTPLTPVPLDTSVQGQIVNYLTSGAGVSSKGLYVVWGGANDYFAMASAIGAQPGLSTTQIQGIVAQQVTPTVTNLTTDVAALAKAGAKSFVVPTLPNLGGTPSLNSSASTAQLGSLVTFSHNTALANAMGALGQQMHVNVYLIDTAGLFSDIQANPSKYGVTNVTQACLTAAGVCANPSSSLFWDSVHPTTGIQQVFSQAVTATVEAPLVIGAQGKMADIATSQIFDGVSSRVAALWQGAAGLTLSGPNGATTQAASNSPMSFYISGSFGEGERDSLDTQTGFNYTHGSVQAGADMRAGEHAAIGVQAGFGTTGATLKDGMGNDDLRTYSLAVYGAMFGDDWYGSVAGFYAYQDFDKLNRNTYVVGQVAAGSTSGTDLGVKLEGGYMFHGGGLTYGPVAELRYARVFINAYSETGAVALNEEIDDQSYNSIISQIGGQVSTSIDADGVIWHPIVHVAWDHQFAPGTRDVFSRLASLPQATIDTPLSGSGRDWARVGLGLNIQATKSISVLGDIDGTAGRADGQDVSGMLRVLYQF